MRTRGTTATPETFEAFYQPFVECADLPPLPSDLGPFLARGDLELVSAGGAEGPVDGLRVARGPYAGLAVSSGHRLTRPELRVLLHAFASLDRAADDPLSDDERDALAQAFSAHRHLRF
jgi:hypothetical protein